MFWRFRGRTAGVDPGRERTAVERKGAPPGLPTEAPEAPEGESVVSGAAVSGAPIVRFPALDSFHIAWRDRHDLRMRKKCANVKVLPTTNANAQSENGNIGNWQQFPSHGLLFAPEDGPAWDGNEQTDLLAPNGVRDVSRVSGEQIRVLKTSPNHWIPFTEDRGRHAGLHKVALHGGGLEKNVRQAMSSPQVRRRSGQPAEIETGHIPPVRSPAQTPAGHPATSVATASPPRPPSPPARSARRWSFRRFQSLQHVFVERDDGVAEFFMAGQKEAIDEIKF